MRGLFFGSPAWILHQPRGIVGVIGAFNYPADLQAPAKVTSDLTLSLGDYGLFVKGLYFYN